MHKMDVLDNLVLMSAKLGRPENDYVLYGEGNTSARIDDESFYVKASGTCLENCSSESFVEVKFSKVLDMLDGPVLSDEEAKERLSAALVNPSGPPPSIETLFHAYLLTLPGVNFVGHTHPTAVNIILCSSGARDIIESRVYVYESIHCGAHPLFVPFAHGGVRLGRAIRPNVEAFMREERAVPKVILVQNHGLIALGTTPVEVEAITAMWTKTARILAGACVLGGLQRIPDHDERKEQGRTEVVMVESS